MAIETRAIAFNGFVVNNQVAGYLSRPYFLTVTRVYIEGLTAPSAGDFTVQIRKNGIVQAQVFTLTQGSTTSDWITVSGGGLAVAANVTLSLVIAGASGAGDVTITLEWNAASQPSFSDTTDLGLGTLGQLKDFILATTKQGIGTDYDAAITALGKGMAATFDGYCNRVFKRQIGRQQTWPAPRDMVIADCYPIEETPAIVIDLKSVETTGYETQNGVIISTEYDNGIIEFAAVIGIRRSVIRATYTGGYWYDTTADLSGRYRTARINCRMMFSFHGCSNVSRSGKAGMIWGWQSPVKAVPQSPLRHEDDYARIDPRRSRTAGKLQEIRHRMNIVIQTNAAEVLAKCNSTDRWMGAAIARGLDLGNEKAISHIRVNHLRAPPGYNPTTLHVVTAMLWKSITASKAVNNWPQVSTVIGTNVEYAAIHEFGFHGNVRVKPRETGYLRVQKSRNQFAKLFVNGKLKRVQTVRGVAYVQASKSVKSTGWLRGYSHSREMNMPARPFIRPGITETLPDYSDIISRRIVTAWNGRN